MNDANQIEVAIGVFRKLYQLQKESHEFEPAQANEFRGSLKEMQPSDIFRLLDEAATLPAVTESDVYWACIYELQGRCNEEAFSVIKDCSVSTATIHRCAAASVLGEFGVSVGSPFETQSLPILERLLNDAEPSVVAASLYALGHIHKGNLDTLIGLQSSANAEIRRALVHALISRPEIEAIEALISFSRDDDTYCRDWATFGLGSMTTMDSPVIRDTLAARLMDSDQSTREEAIVGLARRVDQRAIEAILEALGASSAGPLVFEACAMMPNARFIPDLQAFAARNPDDKDIELALDACCAGKAVEWLR